MILEVTGAARAADVYLLNGQLPLGWPHALARTAEPHLYHTVCASFVIDEGLRAKLAECEKSGALHVRLLALPLSAAAQQRPTVGLGVGIAPFAVPSMHAGVVSRTVELYVPLAVGPTFRLEPSFGLATNDQPGAGVDTRDLTLGIGGFLVSRMAPTADMYAGARLKLNFARVEDGATGADSSGTDLQIAGAFGGEVYLVSVPGLED